MYCLTLKHPWPFAVCFLGKTVENRRWRPPVRAVGQRLLIHGGLVPRYPSERLAALETARELAAVHRPDMDVDDLEDRVFACTGLVAVARLEKCVVSSLSPWFHGPFGWVLGDVVAFPEPIPCLGKRGLWELPAGLLGAVERATEEGRSIKA
mgnify:FL=1